MATKLKLALQDEIRTTLWELRVKPLPLKVTIRLLQRASDRIDELEGEVQELQSLLDG